jgi:hypothetical protein
MLTGETVEALPTRRGMKYRPQPKHGRELIPVPGGQVMYDSLKTSIVDFARLITILENEAYTGYVRLLTEEAAGLILICEGSALECMYKGASDPRVVLGKPALQQFNDDVARGDGVLDVVGLSTEVINGLYELTVSKPTYTDLYASWVDIRALLNFLHKRKLSGSVMIRAKAGTGVIILAQGEFAGAYTSESPDLSDEPDGALALCEDPTAMIEVKSADAIKHAPLNMDEVVAAHRVAARTQTPHAAVPPLPPPSPPAPPAPEQATSTSPARPVTPPELTAAPAATASYPTMRQDTGAFPAPSKQPALQAPSITPPAPTEQQLDWAAIVAELQAMAEDALGHRARKVKDILGVADPSIAGIEAAIDQITTITLLFVESSRLERLAQAMKVRLEAHR